MSAPIAHLPAAGPALADIAKLYRRSFARCWPASLLLALVSVVVSLRLDAGLPRLESVDDLAPMLQYLGSAAFWAPLLVLALVSLWLFCAMIIAILSVERSEPPPLAGGLPAGLAAFPGALVGAMLTSLLVLAGTLLLVIPGIYVAGMVPLWIVALISERRGPLAAIRSGWQLLGGRWWQANTIISLALLGGLLLAALSGLLAGQIGAALASLLHLEASLAQVLDEALTGIGGFLLAPVLPVTLVLIYSRLQTRVA